MKASNTELIIPASPIGERQVDIKINLQDAGHVVLSFSQLVQQGIDAWERAGDLLVRAIDANPNIRSEILKRCPNLSEAILSRFEYIGRRILHPKTLLNNSPGMVRLRVLPYEQQEKYLTEPVSVVFPLPSGKIEVQKLMISLLSKAQALQVIGKDGVRSIREQRELLAKKGQLKEEGNIRNGNENEAHRLRQLYEKLEKPEEKEEPSVLLSGATARMDAALERAHLALMDARTELSMIHHNHPLDGYVAGCLKGVGILRLAIQEGRIKP